MQNHAKIMLFCRMNFLAHIYLSGNDEHLMLGNFIADFIHRGDYSRYDDRILKGVRLHHVIDRFMDAHALPRQGAERLKPLFGRYSGVIIDIVYDHFLAVEWERYSPQKLADFADNAYQIFFKYTNLLPESVQGFLPFMSSQNWLVQYGTLGGFRRSLEGLSRRARFMTGFERALPIVQEYYGDYRNEFNAFFPEIIAQSKTFLQNEGA